MIKQPNVIFLLQDQMQQRVLHESSGCILPNMRALMAEGVSFERAYTCNAICSPSRATLLTGTLPHVHGMVDCTHTVPSYRAEFNDRLDTVTQALHDSGCRVSYYGKWHIERTHHLEKFGVDAYETERSIPSFPVHMQESVTLVGDGYATRTLCGVFAEGPECTEEQYIYDRAIADIGAHADSGQPFCTFISTYAPHDPYCVPRSVYDLYDGVPITVPDSFDDAMEDKPVIYRRMRDALRPLTREEFCRAIRCYYSYCTLVDLQIGRLVRWLREKGLYDNTLIVCMSDHGDMMGAHRLMMKSVEAFEEIYHIPLFMKLPGGRQAGERVGFHVCMDEVGPTVLELAGARPLRGQVGASVVPWLRGERSDERDAFAEFFGQRYAYTQRIVWHGQMKYVFNAFAQDELYDLAADPGEVHNLAALPAWQQTKRELCARMWQKIRATGDTTLLDAGYYPLRIAPVGPGESGPSASYSVYNKQF